MTTDGRIRRDYRFTTVPEHLVRDRSLSDRAFRLWCILDRYAGADGQAFPLRSTLAEDLGTSRASLDRALVELCESGWLSKERREAGGSNDYTLHVLPAPEERPKKGRKKPAGKKKPQVNEEPVLTSEDTPPVLTSEDTPRLTSEDTLDSPVTTPVLTGESHKEESPKGDPEKETSDDSLRSSSASADQPGGQPALDGLAIEPVEPVLRFKTARRIPDDFAVTNRMREWFVAKEFWTNGVDPDHETEQFVDHFLGTGAKHLDWEATWRKWMRTANERAVERRSRGRGGDPRRGQAAAPQSAGDRQRLVDTFNGARPA